MSDGLADSAILTFARTLRKGWLLVACVMTAVLATVAFYTLTATKIYESSTTVMFDPKPARPLGTDVQTAIDMNVGSYLENKDYYRTQQEVLTSRRMLAATIRRLRLNYDQNFIENKPGVAVRSKEVTSEYQAVKILRSRLDVRFVKDTRVLRVVVEDAHPVRAQQILKGLTDVFVQQNLDDAVESSTSAADWLEGQLAKLKVELQDTELSLHTYKIKNNILSASLDDQSNMLREEMIRLNTALTDARAKREAIASRRRELSTIEESNPLDLPASELLTSSVLSSLRQSFVVATSEQNALIGAGKGASHPEVRAAEAKVAATQQALLAEIRNIKSAVDRDHAAINGEVAGLSGLVASANKRALDLNLLEIEYNRLNRSRTNTEKLYSLVLERSKELDLTRMMRFNNIRVLDTANLPEGPVKPRAPLNLALGAVVGFALGMAGAFGRERLDRTVKTPEDVETNLGLPALGLLPAIDGGIGNEPYAYSKRQRPTRPPGSKEPLRPIEFGVYDFPSSGLAEAARSVRTNLMFMSPDRPFRTMLITSAGPVEGKTTVACCVAIAMAQANQRVVLVDCDMRRPRLHRIFGKTNDFGLTSVLLDPGALDQSLSTTEVENLTLLRCGPLPPNPAELLHSSAFARLLNELRQRFDRVIVDSPPVAPVTDAAILSKQVDGTLFVMRAFRTRRDMADKALRSIRSVGGHLIGAVLNDVDLSRHEYGYPYYYYRREGYGPEATKGASAQA